MITLPVLFDVPPVIAAPAPLWHGSQGTSSSALGDPFWHHGEEQLGLLLERAQEEVITHRTSASSRPMVRRFYIECEYDNSGTSGVPGINSLQEIHNSSAGAQGRRNAKPTYQFIHSFASGTGWDWEEGATTDWLSPVRLFASPGSATSDQWMDLSNTIENWLHLSADWDGDDGCAPSRVAVNSAVSFLNRALRARLPLPEATVDGDGEIAFRWKGQESSASACFLSDGAIVAYVSHPGVRPLYKLDERYNEQLELSKFFENVRSLS